MKTRNYTMDNFGIISNQGRFSKYLGVSKNGQGAWLASINYAKSANVNSSIGVVCSDEYTAASVATVMYMCKEFCDRIRHKMPARIINATNYINNKTNDVITVNYYHSTFSYGAVRGDTSFLNSVDFSSVKNTFELSQGVDNSVIKTIIRKLREGKLLNVSELELVERVMG